MRGNIFMVPFNNPIRPEASMRPPHNAGEYGRASPVRQVGSPRFNEAPA